MTPARKGDTGPRKGFSHLSNVCSFLVNLLSARHADGGRNLKGGRSVDQFRGHSPQPRILPKTSQSLAQSCPRRSSGRARASRAPLAGHKPGASSCSTDYRQRAGISKLAALQGVPDPILAGSIRARFSGLGDSLYRRGVVRLEPRRRDACGSSRNRQRQFLHRAGSGRCEASARSTRRNFGARCHERRPAPVGATALRLLFTLRQRKIEPRRLAHRDRAPASATAGANPDASYYNPAARLPESPLSALYG